jgi:hypothetical protein
MGRHSFERWLLRVSICSIAVAAARSAGAQVKIRSRDRIVIDTGTESAFHCGQSRCQSGLSAV